MGRKCMDADKKRSTHLHIRMTHQERNTLTRVADYLNATDTDIVLNALSWYYGQVFNEKEYNSLVKGEAKA